MYKKEKFAFGWPGIDARWTTSAKSGVGTSLHSTSKVWYSISHGILNEVYYPQVDQACTRDLTLIVTYGKDFFSEEKNDTTHHIKTIAKGVPGYHITNSCKAHHYRIEKSHGAEGTRTTVRKLSPDERREEIARMLSGASITDEARAQAARLLDAA